MDPCLAPTSHVRKRIVPREFGAIFKQEVTSASAVWLLDSSSSCPLVRLNSLEERWTRRKRREDGCLLIAGKWFGDGVGTTASRGRSDREFSEDFHLVP